MWFVGLMFDKPQESRVVSVVLWSGGFEKPKKHCMVSVVSWFRSFNKPHNTMWFPWFHGLKTKYELRGFGGFVVLVVSWFCDSVIVIQNKTINFI